MDARPRHPRVTAPPPPTTADIARALGVSEEYVRERAEAYRRYCLGIARGNLRPEYYSLPVRPSLAKRLVRLVLRVAALPRRPKRG